MDSLLKSFVRNSILPISIFDRDMRLLELSDAWKRMYQIADENISRIHYETFPETPDHWIAAHHAALNGNTLAHVEEPYQLANGATGWHRWQCTPWYNSENEIVGIIITAEDITARKERELELNNVLARFELIQQAAKIGMWDWDIPTRKITLNAEYYDILRLEKGSTVAYADFTNLIHAEDLPRVKKAMSTALENGSDYEAEFRITRKNDGKLRWVRDKGYIEFDDNRGPVRGYGAIIDVTQQKLLSNEQIRNVAEEYEKFMNSMLEGVWGIDKNGITTYANTAMAKMLGCTEDDMVGKSVFAFIDDAMRNKAIEKLAAKKEGRFDRYEFPLRRVDGETIWCLFGSNPIFENNEYIGAVGVVMDYTERKQAEIAKDKRLEELERLLAERN